MNESVAKKTQETLGKVIKKPPLTEKLLSKPPFRYLHDIFSEVSYLKHYSYDISAVLFHSPSTYLPLYASNPVYRSQNASLLM